MSLKKRYCCVYIPYDSINILYFELTLNKKNLKNIVLQINNEFNINFEICKSTINDQYGILLQDKSNKINQKFKNINYNIIFISHLSNLDNYVKNNIKLVNKSNLEQIISLCYSFILYEKNFKI